MKDVYLVRHAQAAGGPSKMDRDFFLTPLGERQAHACGRQLAELGVRPSRIFASRLRRAFQTATIISQHIPAPVEERDDLIEHGSAALLLDCTIEEAARLRSECVLPDGSVLQVQGSRADGLNWDFSIGGEDMRTLHARARAAWDAIVGPQADDSTILIVSHGSFLSAMVTEVLRLPLQPVWNFGFANAAFMNIKVYRDSASGRDMPVLAVPGPAADVPQTAAKSERVAK